jgi:uncharacterized protein (DUF2062 family)
MKERYLRLVRAVYRKLRHRRVRRHPWLAGLSQRLLDRTLWRPCRHTVAGGLAIGLFFAMMPMPFQTVAAAVFAIRARVNIPFAAAACWVTNPFTEPFVRIFQEQMGGWLRETIGLPVPAVIRGVEWTFAEMTFNLADFLIGVFACGILLSLLAYPITRFVSLFIPHRHLPADQSRHPVRRRLRESSVP